MELALGTIIFFDWDGDNALDQFSGFDSLYSITYSSGIDFIYKLLDLFDEAEIIFGCQEVMSYSLQEIMAFQNKTLERMCEIAIKKQLDLINRIDDGNFEVYGEFVVTIRK